MSDRRLGLLIIFAVLMVFAFVFGAADSLFDEELLPRVIVRRPH